jgi:hypothetical protein
MTVGSERAGRFGAGNQRLIAVIAGTDWRRYPRTRGLHDSVRRGKREWEQRSTRSAIRSGCSTAAAACCGGNTALAALMGRSVTQLRGATCHEVGFCAPCDGDCAITRALDQIGTRTEVTRPDGQIFSVTTFPVGGGHERRVCRPGREERHR